MVVILLITIVDLISVCHASSVTSTVTTTARLPFAPTLGKISLLRFSSANESTTINATLLKALLSVTLQIPIIAIAVEGRTFAVLEFSSLPVWAPNLTHDLSNLAKFVQVVEGLTKNGTFRAAGVSYVAPVGTTGIIPVPTRTNSLLTITGSLLLMMILCGLRRCWCRSKREDLTRRIPEREKELNQEGELATDCDLVPQYLPSASLGDPLPGAAVALKIGECAVGETTRTGF